jgi:holliday junction DNA helicase RuvA
VLLCTAGEWQDQRWRARLSAALCEPPPAICRSRPKLTVQRGPILISEISGEVLYDRIRRNSLLVRANSLCYEVLVPSGIASRLRHAPESERRNPLTLYTIYYIDGAVGGGHLTPKLVGFLDPLDREFFEAFTTVPGVGFMKALKCLIQPINEIAQAIERGDTLFLKQLPFIGTKTAERIVMELRGKMAKFALAHAEEPLSIEKEPASDLRAEAQQVLEQLEFSRGEAQRMVAEIFAKHKNLKSVEEFLHKVFEQKQGEAGTRGQ